MRYAVLTAIMAAILCASCSGGSSQQPSSEQVSELISKGAPVRESSSIYVDPQADWTWDLIAGQNQLAGTVSVSNDQNNLYVSYSMDPAWPLQEAHVYVGADQPSKGAPGQFPYKQEFDPAVLDYTFEIPLGELEGKSLIYLATHATAGASGNTETAWGGYWNDGSPSWDFGWGKKWGGGFTTRVMPFPELPTEPVSYRGFHFGQMSYWNIRFNTALSLPPGSFEINGQEYWAGWCIDKHHSMFTNRDYLVTLYSSYDQTIPAFGQKDNYDLINWMLTQRRNNGSGIWNQNWNSNAIKTEFQNAVWYFSDGIDTTPGSLAESFVNEAIANGENFIPGPGEFYGIILYPDTSTNNNQVRAQMNIIEVDP
ncbi:Cys-Gln thioester bond-forming surface protein [bacterium]|nr:Cys-Gln thioester bond-forming surface protein [bacterium]